MLFYAAREADLHKFEYYPEHLANRRFYTHPEVPILDRVLIGLVLLTLVIVIVTLLIRVAPSFLNAEFYGKALEEVGELTAGGIAALIVWYFPPDGGRSCEDDG